MKKTLLGFTVFAAALGFLFGVELRDASGTLVRLEKPPVAVVSLTLMTDEFVADLLPPQRILAYSRTVDDPVLSNVVAQAKAVPGRAWLDLELLIKLRPDLILAADWSSSSELQFLREKGFTVFVVKTPTTWSGVKATVSQLGLLLGMPESATAVLARLQGQERTLAEMRQKIRRQASVLEYNSFGSSMSRGTLFPEMVALAGLVDASAGLVPDAFGFAPLSVEMLLKINPDWLVLPSQATLEAYGTPAFLKDLRSDPVFQALGAAKNNRLIFLSDAVKTSTSPYVLRTAEQLLYAAYPDLR